MFPSFSCLSSIVPKKYPGRRRFLERPWEHSTSLDLEGYLTRMMSVAGVQTLQCSSESVGLASLGDIHCLQSGGSFVAVERMMEPGSVGAVMNLPSHIPRHTQSLCRQPLHGNLDDVGDSFDSHTRTSNTLFGLSKPNRDVKVKIKMTKLARNAL
jgi:hypothetical protein